MAKISCNFFDNPSSKMDVIGVTGTNGKTSITTFLSEILSGINKVGIVGTIKIFDGDKEIESKILLLKVLICKETLIKW